MQKIRDAVLQCLKQNSDEDKLVRELERIIVVEGEASYSAILNVFTHLSLESTEARSHWQRIISHWQKLKQALAREVSLRTAICDYFCSVQKSLKNIKVVDIQVFEDTVKYSRHDVLTGLLNRKSFDEALAREIALARRHELDMSLLFLDLDDFKEVNDTYGHEAGDLVLRGVADIIRDSIRSEDIACRYGGEELVVIFPQIDREGVMVVAERIRAGVEEMRLADKGGNISLTISGGLASYPVDGSDAEEILACADNALYRAKGSGKNNIAFCSSDKRRYVRVSVGRIIRVKELGVDGKAGESATSKDISVGGLLFEYGGILEIGSLVELEIPLHREKPLFVIGNVVRVEHLENGRYDIGISISFLRMEKTARQEISDFLKERRGRKR